MKEANYLDVSCPKCGHIPQGQKHLCDLEATPSPHEDIEIQKAVNQCMDVIYSYDYTPAHLKALADDFHDILTTHSAHLVERTEAEMLRRIKEALEALTPKNNDVV